MGGTHGGERRAALDPVVVQRRSRPGMRGVGIRGRLLAVPLARLRCRIRADQMQCTRISLRGLRKASYAGRPIPSIYAHISSVCSIQQYAIRLRHKLEGVPNHPTTIPSGNHSWMVKHSQGFSG